MHPVHILDMNVCNFKPHSINILDVLTVFSKVSYHTNKHNEINECHVNMFFELDYLKLFLFIRHQAKKIGLLLTTEGLDVPFNFLVNNQRR